MVVCYADAHAIQFADRLVSDGRWRLIGQLTNLRNASRH
jgi:hypothetical protein